MGIRTDLAVETREMYHAEHGAGCEVPGVSVDVSMAADGVSVTRIEGDRTGQHWREDNGKACRKLYNYRNR